MYSRLSLAHWLLALALILGVAAALRLPALDRIPPGFQFDEAYNAIDAWRVVQGNRDIFFPANGGREPLLSYWQAIFFALLGPNLAALRLASAVISLVTLVVVALALPRLFPHRPDADRLGLVAAGVLAVMYWYLHFSRYSIRAILVPLFMTVVFLTYYRGTVPQAPRILLLWITSIALAGSVYAHPTGRLLPLALAVYTAWLMWTDRRHAVGYGLSFAFVGAASFALFLPLGFYFLDHQWLFWGHPSDVSVFDPSVSPQGPLRVALDQSLALLGMIFVRGDRSQFHNLPGRPTFDPLLAIFFIAGLILMVRDAWRQHGLNRAPYVLLFLWAGIAVLPSWLTDAAPNFSRAIGVLPVLALVVAVGLGWLADRVQRTIINHQFLIILILSLSAIWTARDYFQVWASQPELYYSYDADKEDMARQVQNWSQTGVVYVAPLLATQSTFAFLTRDNPPLMIELERGLVLPASNGREVHYVFPAQLERRARRLTGWLNEAATRQDIANPLGAPLIVRYTLPSVARPQFEGERVIWGAVRPEENRFDRFEAAPYLVGVSGDQKRSPGDRAQYVLYWRTPTVLTQRLTLFAHLVDATGKTVLQDDHEPLATSYPTLEWQTNEVILDYLEFRLPDTFPVGTYQLRVGWYDLATGERRPLTIGGTELLVRVMEVVPEGQ